MVEKLLNEYHEKMGEIAHKYGATLDVTVGDGAIFRFNIPNPVKNHEYSAICAAIEMKLAFESIKEYWLKISVHHNQLEKLFTRIGIANGELVQVNLGHSQKQQPTVMGSAVGLAKHICDSGQRNKSIILISDLVHLSVKDKILTKQYLVDLPEKAKSFTTKVYEVIDKINS